MENRVKDIVRKVEQTHKRIGVRRKGKEVSLGWPTLN